METLRITYRRARGNRVWPLHSRGGAGQSNPTLHELLQNVKDTRAEPSFGARDTSLHRHGSLPQIRMPGAEIRDLMVLRGVHQLRALADQLQARAVHHRRTLLLDPLVAGCRVAG